MTRVLVAYGSKHGGTAEIAEQVATALREAVRSVLPTDDAHQSPSRV